ncbi:4'-phosphopantetheinyl transferase family protein [Flavobacterium lacisediminis]|uniref:4'-phosphopantetheinyl transferase superfamily protein n=1 Tax=Flavobacterium lacisediminis TaxID=2989705 RepID=A0ABT3EDH0_9FLAO|nr:4'-phosphopantetheinyl transferase superfamily protein [Flavobacterium lacisediminis]MCW1146617.1 4'-phosphopantetheinyl transferase superfamily protein [Flavobacterium lacisediminis]
MPLHKILHINENTTAYFWHITEDVTWLFRAVSLRDTSLFRLEGMKSEEHQRGFLAVRMLLQHLGYTDYDLTYDEAGKPHLSDGKHISISHSHEFSCICISNKLMGIDLEKLKEKTLKIAPRFMEVKHLENLSTLEQIEKSTVIWGVKESIFKIKNEKGISFPEHIFEAEFDLKNGKCEAELHFNNQIENFQIQFYNVEAYIFVCAFPKK